MLNTCCLCGTTHNNEEIEENKSLRHLIAGGFAGLMSRTCTAPVDRVKVFMQIHKEPTMLQSFKGLVEDGGYICLWRGNGVNVLKVASDTAIKFSVYEKIKSLLRGDVDRRMSIEERLIAGGVAAVFAQTIVYPLDVIKTRLVLSRIGEFEGILSMARDIYAHEGFMRFYRGYKVNMLGTVPYTMIDLTLYETLKRWIKTTYHYERSSFVSIILCGCISTSVGQIYLYPLALIRTRLQAKGVLQHANVIGIFRDIIRREGVFGLYRGIIPTLIKVLPAVTINYVVYEYTMRYMGISMSS